MNARSDRTNSGARPGRDNRSRGREPPRRSVTPIPGGELPRWVREEIQRSTPKDRREPAIQILSKALAAFADERYAASLPDLRKAKELSPRSATIRELMGLAAYRTEHWEEALRELRTFRRMTGDLSQMAVEMDCLRALGRPSDVIKTWELLKELETSPSVPHEALVVYASFLLDQGRPRDAWAIIKPGRLVGSPSPGELRHWYVAAKVALAAGDINAAQSLVAALDRQAPDFEGVDELRAAVQ